MHAFADRFDAAEASFTVAEYSIALRPEVGSLTYFLYDAFQELVEMFERALNTRSSP